MKHLKVNLVISIVFLLTFSIQAALSEIRVRVNDGSTALLIEVFVYSSSIGGYIPFDSGSSIVDTNQYHFQAKCDVGDDNTTDPTWASLSFNRGYLIKIGSRYCKLSIGNWEATPDFDLKYYYGGFSEITTTPHDIITLGEQGNWYTKTVMVKNSFDAGNVKVDGELYQSIGSGGVTKYFGSPTFPHKLEAIDDQQPSGVACKQIFQNWYKNDISYSNNAIASISSISATYEARFLKEFDLTFKNSFVGVGNGGTIKVNGVPVNSPTEIYHMIEDDQQGISFEAVYQVINGIEYLFDQWSDGNTSTSRTIYPDGHEDFVANFNGRPSNSYRGLTFNYGARVGTPIKLYWNEHQNTAVTQYQIWRKHGKLGTQNLIATVNRGTTTYTDYDLGHTRNTSTANLTWYDVRAYYSIENSYADTNFVTLYGEWLEKQSNDKMDSTNAITEVKENSITNFPNPFNPTTTVYYKLKERGNVTIKVYDALGKEVAVLVNESKTMGDYVAKFDGSRLSSGVYIIRMQINNSSISKKILLAK
jgi:hypothetical protein